MARSNRLTKNTVAEKPRSGVAKDGYPGALRHGHPSRRGLRPLLRMRMFQNQPLRLKYQIGASAVTNIRPSAIG